MAVAAMVACELPPPGPDLDPGDPAEVDCTACHIVDELFVPVSGAAPRDWMGEQGRGVVRDPGVLSLTGEPVLSLAWPRRGHHGEAQREDCAACHPVFRRTNGHGLSQYAAAGRTAAFEGGTDCASSCHDWLPAEAEVVGFAGAAGAPAGWNGSLRPADLLAVAAEADLGHGRVWRDGYVEPEEPDDDHDALGLRVNVMESGCGGCHNSFSDDHGALSMCTDCHDLGFASSRGSHERHVARIDDDVARRAPALADTPSCAFCHCDDGSPDSLCRAACYNCHVSGHLTAPILWTGEAPLPSE